MNKKLRQFILYCVVALVGAVFLIWPPKEIDENEMKNVSSDFGVLELHNSKGSYSLLFNGHTLSCASGDFFGTGKCPGLADYAGPPIESCKASFAKPVSRFGRSIKILVDMDCPGIDIPELKFSNLNECRARDRSDAFAVRLPIVFLGIVFFFFS